MTAKLDWAWVFTCLVPVYCLQCLTARLTNAKCSCEPPGCKNRPHSFPDWMSYWVTTPGFVVSDIAIFVLKRDVKLQLTHLDLVCFVVSFGLLVYICHRSVRFSFFITMLSYFLGSMSFFVLTGM